MTHKTTQSTDNGRRTQLRDSERGSGVMTGLILLPILIAFAELIVLGGRVAAAQSDMNAAAREAARQASISTDFASATGAITPVAATALEGRGHQCTNPTSRLGPATRFEAGGDVHVIVECTVNMADLSFLGILPGSRTFTGAALELSLIHI